MRNKLNLIEESLDTALLMFENGELTGKEYAIVVHALEHDYKELMRDYGTKNANQLIDFLLKREPGL